MGEVISFNRGVPATSALPSKSVSEAASDMLEVDGENLLQYGDSRGYLPFRKTIAEKYEADSESEVLVGNGSLQILDALAHVYLSPGDSVLVESPTYDRALTIFDRVGVDVFGVELEENGIHVDQFEQLLKGVNPKLFYTIADFHNPTGVTTAGSKREKVVKLAKDSGLTIIEDSPYRKLRYFGEDEPSYRSFDSESVIQMSSVSKLVGPGIRVGWIVARKEIIDETAQFVEDTYITPNLLSQGVVNKLMRDGWIEENIKRLVKLYKPRLEATLSGLDKYFGQSQWIKAKGGFFVGLWLPDSTDVRSFYSKAKNQGLILSSPDGFYPDYSGEGFVRLPFPALSPSEIESGVQKLAKAWSEL